MGDRTPNADATGRALLLRLTRRAAPASRPAADPAIPVIVELFDGDGDRDGDGDGALAASTCRDRGIPNAPLDPAEVLAGAIDAALRAARATAEAITVTIEADGDLLALDWERAMAALSAPVLRLRRRRHGTSKTAVAATAGPLKILVAVAAPSGDVKGDVDDDRQRTTRAIIDAVTAARARPVSERVQVRILDAATVESLTTALRHDCYHVVHLAAPMSSALVSLEDGGGRARLTDARMLGQAFAPASATIPLVVLVPANDGGATMLGGELASGLLAGNVDRVLTMHVRGQAARTVEMVGAFYRRLRSASSSALSVGAIVDQVLSDLEQSSASGSADRRCRLFLAGGDGALVDDALPTAPLSEIAARTLHPLLPTLRPEAFVGRYDESRQALRLLERDVTDLDERDGAVVAGIVGAVLTGSGGVGKSALAAQMARQLVERRWVLAVHRGRLSLVSLAAALADGLATWTASADGSGGNDGNEGGGVVGRGKRSSPTSALRRRLEDARSDTQLVRAVTDTVSTHRVLIVLEDFDDNFAPAGDAFADSGIEIQFGRLLARLGRSRMLIISRQLLPSHADRFVNIPVAPLSASEVDRLSRHLTGVGSLDEHDRAVTARTVGGHPRLLTMLDALLRSAPRAPVVDKLGRLVRDESLRVGGPARADEGSITTAMRTAARDVLLDALVDLFDIDERRLLYALAPSNIPATIDEVAIVAGRTAAAAQRSLRRLVDLALVGRDERGHLHVDRWTADGLRVRDAAAFRGAAAALGAHRMAIAPAAAVRPEQRTIEPLRNLLSGAAWDAAADLAVRLCGGGRASSPPFTAAVASEVLDQLPITHRAFAELADIEGQADIALGHTTKAVARYEQLVSLHRITVEAHAERASAQRDLFVSCYKLGDLMLATGRGRRAEDLHLEALTIIDRLARAEPGNDDYQRDLSVSYNKLGDVMVADGKTHEAARLYERSLSIAGRLVHGAPGNEDYRRNLAVSYNNLGDLAIADGDRDGAAALYDKSLALITELAQSGVDRVGLQRDLAVSYERLGDLARVTGNADRAAALFDASYRIRALLAQRDPDRAELQRDLATSYERLGDTARAAGDVDGAWHMHHQAFTIRLRLIESDAARAEYWRELSISHNKLGDLLRMAQQHTAAAGHYNKSLAIRERLSAGDPERADFQRDLSVSYQRLGLLAAIGAQQSDAAAYYRRGIAITEALIASEPDRVDLRCELGTKLYQLAMVLDDPGPALRQLVGILAPLEADGRIDDEARTTLRAARQRLSPG